jgi:ribosomal protein S1
MTENNNLDKTVTSFKDGENISMSDLVRNYDKADNADFEKGIEVTIIEENADGFMVDLRVKSEGIIPKKEFKRDKVPAELKVGAKVKLLNTYGHPVLSYRKVIEKAKWDAVQEAFKNAERLPGTIIKTVKSGFLVDIGVITFLYISQLDMCFIKEP